jgi:hypothetical protein
MDQSQPDPRLNAYRADLADAHLEGRVAAARFVAGWPGQVRVAIAHVFGAPDAGGALTTQLLFGETVRVFEEHEGWAWVQADADGYVGYVPAAAISRAVGSATHKIAALSTPAMARPDVKSPPLVDLPLGARVAVEREDNGFAALAIGAFIPLPHLAGLDAREADFVAVAERFLGSPYLWGGGLAPASIAPVLSRPRSARPACQRRAIPICSRRRLAMPSITVRRSKGSGAAISCSGVATSAS